jgi:cell division septation protein DedD
MRKKNKKVSLAKKPFLVLSRRAIAGWLVAVFFVCAWMFTIGVLVGRGTSPLKIDISELQKKLADAREELAIQEQAQTAEKSDTVKDKTDLEFYEALKKNREDADIPDVPSAPLVEKKTDPPASPTPPAPQTSPKPKKESKKRLTKTQLKAEEPAAAPEKQPAETALPQSPAAQSKTQAAGKPYAIQVAAFKAAGDADKLVAELKQKKFSAYRVIGKVPGKGIWYRVRVGEYLNKAEASQTLANLKREGLKPVIVEK